MKSEKWIEDRLRHLEEEYRISSDMYNPVLQGRIKELHEVLKDENYISHDG